MRRVTQIGHTLQRRAQRLLDTVDRTRTASRRGGLDGMRAPRGTDAFNVEFVLQATACIDWSSLLPWMEAIDARLGAPLPAAVYKLHILATWFSLDAQSVALACSTRAEFRRFIGAPLHGPIVDVELYLEYAPKLRRARDVLAKLDAAVELQLIEHGFLAPADALQKLDLGKTPGSATPTLVLPRASIPATAVDAARTAPAPNPRIDAPSPGVDKASAIGAPVLIWPWGTMTMLFDRVAVGRDAGFCDFAVHLAADCKVSRKHALLTPVENGVLVQDLGASNGTYVDDDPIPYATTRLVSSDACLRFGTDLAVMLAFVPDR